jgi:hypothetical protein
MTKMGQGRERDAAKVAENSKDAAPAEAHFFKPIGALRRVAKKVATSPAKADPKAAS